MAYEFDRFMAQLMLIMNVKASRVYVHLFHRRSSQNVYEICDFGRVIRRKQRHFEKLFLFVRNRREFFAGS